MVGVEQWSFPGLLPAHIAQSVEHFLGKEEVTGSSPVVGLNACEESEIKK